MIFLKTNELVSEMRVARDIHFYDLHSKKMVELKKNCLLTDLMIESISNSNVEGIYIDNIPDNFKISHTIDDGLKNEAVNGITSLSDNFLKNIGNFNQIISLNKTASKLIETVSADKNLMVNIFDLKKYDDYTYHHSLSVAVISLGIGIEMKLNNQLLQELVLSAMMHDIGKVSIPIEIINKPSRLTPEEFEIVKAHPLNAAVYLLKNNLVTENTFKGIVSHHEKWDGTGYPNKLSKTNIPLFGRIITVADVYDALTSTRPYRKPSEPTEAIEYIMGGVGTYFDEDIVKLFLRRIAPYPAGIKILLSNGKPAQVIKNNPDQPLRPVISLSGTGELLDLYNDPTTYNVVIKETLK